MKKFKFRLERVLNFKNSEKSEHKRALSIKNQDLHEAEDTLEEIISAQDSSAPVVSDTTTMADYHLQGVYQRSLQEALLNQRLLVLEASRAVELARDAYIEKKIEAETLESLREKKHEQFRIELSKREQKQIDEMVVQRHRIAKAFSK